MPSEDSMGRIAGIGDVGASGTLGPAEGRYLDNDDPDTYVRPSRAGILTSILESIATEAPAALPYTEALTIHNAFTKTGGAQLICLTKAAPRSRT